MDEEQKNLEESALNLPEIHSYEDYDHLQAKHRSSVLWLLSKAYNSKIPSHLREPYYKDSEDHGKLKPQIIHSLASAELYCLALSNIYADPNYNSLNHHGVIQTLIRKGIYVVDPSDIPLTETVLVQTAPIKMNAHLTVIEGIMALYIKEVLIPEKIVEVVRRFSRVNMNCEMPSDPEETAILWINKCCIKFRHQIEEELGICHSPDEPGISELHPLVPSVPVLQDLTDLSDGCCLAAVISLYCPNYLKWQDICLNEPMSLADCVYNLQLIEQFCQDHLPCDIHFLTLEDFLYLHSSIKQNALTFVADLLYLFEIWPAKCVIQPGSSEEQESRIEEGHHSHNGQIESQPLSNKIQQFQHSWSPLPNLRAGAYGGSTCSLPDIRMSSRSNGAQHRDKPEKQPVKKSIPDGSYSHNSPALHLRRTNSVNIPDADKIESKTYSQSLSSAKNIQDQKLWSDEDGDSASYVIKQQDEYCVSGGETPPSSPLLGHKIRKSRDRDYATILPARAKEPKERNNHDSKVLERGEEKPRKPNVISSLPAHLLNNEQYPTEIRLQDKSYGSPKHINRHIDSSEEMLWKQKELDKNFSAGKFIPSSHSTTEMKDNEQSIRRQSTGLEDYYNQLATEGESIDENKKIALELNTNNRHIKNWENRFEEQKLIDKMEYLEEKAALESLDPYKTGIYIDDKDNKCPFTTTSFAQLSKLKETNNSAINIVYMQHDKERNPDHNKNPLKSSFLQKSKEKSKSGEEKKTTFAVLPNTTTWQQQYANNTSSPQADSGHETPTESGEPPITTQLCNIRMKLEERRRKIEQDKRRMETLWKKQRQRLGKAAFLQAVSKGNGSGAGTPDSGTGKEPELETLVSAETSAAAQVTSPSLTRQLSIQEIVEDLDSVRKRWLEQNESVVHPQTLERLERDDVEPDEDNIEDFQTSIDQLNTSLNDLQADISRLSHQQDLIQRMMKNSVDNQPQETSQFFLHSQKQSSQHFQKPFVPVSQGPPPSQWVDSSTYPHQPQPDASPRRTQWNHSVHDHHHQQQQHVDHPAIAQQQQWHSPTIISGRPSSVEPQMMGGHPVQSQMHFEQRPPSAVPFDNRPQSFALHSGQPDSFAGYQYGNPPVSRYQNGPTEDSLPCQYGVPAYTVPSSHQYDMPQAHHPQYGGTIYTSPPPSLSNLPQSQQQVPYHLTQEANILQQHSIPPVSLAHAQSPLTKRYELQQPSSTGTLLVNTDQHIGKPDIKNTIYSANESKEFQYSKGVQPGRADGEQILPISKPVIHKTYRISKTVSPPPLVTQGANQEGSGEQVAQLPIQPIKGSEENEKGFYISFDDDQPRKPKPKLRPRLIKNHISVLKTEKDLVNGQETDASPPASEQRLKDAQIDQTDNHTEGKLDDSASTGLGFVIGADLVNPDPDAENEMARRKEMIMMMSLRRRAEQEARRIAKEQEYAQQREQERLRREMTDRKKEEDRLRRQIILEQHRQRKAQEEAEKEGGGAVGGTGTIGAVLRDTSSSNSRSSSFKPKSRSTSKPRPKSVHVSSASHDHSTSFDANPSLNRNSQLIVTGRDYHDFDSDSLNSVSTGSSRHPTSPTQPSSGSSAFSLGLLVGGRGRGTGPPSDGASDTASTTSSALAAEYTGPKLFVKPTAKSNRGIIVNAVNTVLAGAVNSETKRKVLEEINRSESKHFLILFRDAGCQFRALYSYNPDRDDVIKMYGIGPKMVTDHMMDKFYKYNSGGKCFTEVKTKHLTVTIDAFTIHNSLWAGKKVIPPKKDFL